MATVLDAVINLKDNFSNTLATVEKNVGAFSRTTKTIGRDIQRVGRDVEKVGGTLTKSLTLPLIGMGAVATKIGMDFEQSMSNVKAVTGASSDEMVLLEKAARDAGKATSKSAKESAEALEYMGLAGWSVKDSMEGLMPVLRLSEAGNIDLGRASSLVTDSMSAMGIAVKDLPKYLDIVAQTARSSNTDIDQMMESYLGVGGVLRGLNVPLEESSLALGMLANAGIKGSESGKSLSSILTNLTAPTGRAKKALDALGFSAFDSNGEFKGMEDVLYDLQGKMKGMTTEQKNSYMSMIAGKEHIKGLNALMNGLDDSYVDLKGSIKDADGALDEMSKTMLDNNKGSLTQLKSGLEEVGLKVYDTLKPAIADAIELMQKFTDKLNDLTPEQTEMISKFVKLALVIGPALMLVGKMTTGIGGMVKEFGFLAGRIKSLGLMKGIFTPGVMVVGVILALVAAGYLLYKNFDAIKEKVNDVFPNLKETISSVMDNVKDIFTGTIKLLIMAWGWLAPGFTAIWETIKGIFGTGLVFIGEIVESITNILGGIVNYLVSVFTGDWKGAWEAIVQIFDGVFGGMYAVGKSIINGLIDLINGAIGGMNRIKLPDWVPGLGGKGISIPLIPKLAKGTDNWGGGIVQVHERGGEIIDLPGGSRVYPHDKSVDMARKQGRKESGRSISIAKLADQIIIREESDIDKIANALVRKIEQAGLNMA